jgi:hypothetical protein
MSRTSIAALVLATVMLAASGCGGSSKSSHQAASSTQAPASGNVESSASKAPLSRAELIAKADAICKDLNAKRSTIVLRSVADYARYLPQAAAYYRAAIVELDKLNPPASMSRDWQTIIKADRIIAVNTAKVGEDAKAKKIAAIRPLYAATAPIQKHRLATAQRDGFKYCSTL